MRSVQGHVFWLCGHSGAGKSTLASALAVSLRRYGVPVLTLDGDAVRPGLCRGLALSAADREENLRRAAEVARLGSASGLCTVASFITPLEANRQMVGAILGGVPWSLVFVDAPLAICRRRDVKGLYARAGSGLVSEMTGLTFPFEPPATADLVLPTAEETVAASSARLDEFACARLQIAET